MKVVKKIKSQLHFTCLLIVVIPGSKIVQNNSITNCLYPSRIYTVRLRIK